MQIIIAGVINGHVACKYVYLRIFRGSDRMHKRDTIAVASWVGIALGLWVLAWIISSAIPVFSNLLSLIVRQPSALRCYIFNLLLLLTDGPIRQLVHLRLPGYPVAVHEQGPIPVLAEENHAHCGESNYHCYCMCAGMLLQEYSLCRLATFTNFSQCGLGLWVSGKAIHDNPSNASFSCANNA